MLVEQDAHAYIHHTCFVLGWHLATGGGENLELSKMGNSIEFFLGFTTCLDSKYFSLVLLEYIHACMFAAVTLSNYLMAKRIVVHDNDSSKNIKN